MDNLLGLLNIVKYMEKLNKHFNEPESTDIITHMIVITLSRFSFFSWVPKLEIHKRLFICFLTLFFFFKIKFQDQQIIIMRKICRKNELLFVFELATYTFKELVTFCK